MESKRPALRHESEQRQRKAQPYSADIALAGLSGFSEADGLLLESEMRAKESLDPMVRTWRF